jgi:rRNA maturation RNase YbeY
LALRLSNNQRGIPVPAGRLRKAAEEALSSLGAGSAEVGVVLTGDRAVRGLNRNWRGLDEATDVLSFPAFGGRASETLRRRIRSACEKARPGGPPVALGDVVISVPRALVQAGEIGHPLEDELARLIVHGLAHLAGYDHEAGPEEARLMRRVERSIVRRLP